MRRRLQLLRVCLYGVVWAFVAVIALMLAMLYMGGDYWWPASLLLFGPRWLFLIPLALLGGLAAILHRPLLLPISAAVLLVLGPYMGLQVPFARGAAVHGKTVLRVLSCNVQTGDFNEQALRFQVEQSRADIVALQECPKVFKRIVPADWYMVREGDLAVYSRYPIKLGPTLKTIQPPHRWPRMNLLTSTIAINGRNLSFCTVHLPSPRYGIQHLLDRKTLVNANKSDFMINETNYRRNVSAQVRSMVRDLPLPVVIAGDFNLPIESTIYRKDWRDYTNAFSTVGFGYGLSERVLLKGLSFGVRIDHILLSDGVSAVCCHVGDDVGSDHLPVIAEMVLK